ncbi:diguanylate cyclase [Carnobacterium divergens]
MGGEEFAILTSLSKKETTQILAEFRQQLITHPFIENELPLPITVSIGMTEFNYLSDTDSYEGSDILYVRADKALYEAKRAGKDRLVWF